MANKRVIELNERTTIQLADWLLVDDSTGTKKLSMATLISYLSYSAIIFVDQLPTTDINPNMLYLVPHTGSVTEFDEYVYRDSQWNLLGVSVLDLTSVYQTLEDNDLETTSKEIVGAINELNSALSKITYGSRVTLETEVEYNTTSDGYLYLQSGINNYVACFLMDMNNPTSNAHYFAIKCTGTTDNDSQNAVFVRKGTVLKKQGGGGTATFIPLT